MDGMPQVPAATALDAVASLVSLVVYLTVAAAVVARWPRDPRSRVFLAVALTSAVPYVLSPLQWWKGTGAYTPVVITATAVSYTLGSAALFHFTQVFPWRRPWIRAHFGWLAAAYAVLPIPLAAVSWILASLMAPVSDEGGLGAVSVDVGLYMLLLLPAVFVVGLVLPFSGVMSLFKSWQESKKSANDGARATTFWMLISQMAGGVLAVLVLPLLHFVGIGSPWADLIAALTYAFGLIMPLAFAAGVWKYRLLDVSTSA